jgi:heme exporter protein B
MRSFILLFYSEIKLHTRHKAEWASLLLFFSIVIVLMPFALGPEPELLQRLAPGLIWLAAILMSLLSLDRMFSEDARDGTLDEMLTSPFPLEGIVCAKICAQITVMIAALVVMTFPATILLSMNIQLLPVLFVTFVLGIPSVVMLGAIVGALTVALERNAALATLLLIPFYIPVLIFAVSACENPGSTAATSSLLFLAAFLALLLPSAPFIIAGSLRQARG